MSERYNHDQIEKTWQERWARERVFVAAAHPTHKQKRYILDMFPYPSGDGLHVGHPLGYIASDILARYERMNGRQVLHPMGWDAFGLPAENAAIKKGIHPRLVTEQNIATFKRQLQMLGFSYDWSREINTTDPAYYKWTQWIFLQLYKQGLAYEAEAPIWWCPKDKTGLANEEVVNGKCDRCGTTVERKMLKQWMLKITAYADRLLEGLEKLDWPESIKTLQRNWIGRSEGAEINFQIDSHVITVYTTRPDTIFGATYLVLSPEHELVEVITTADQKKAVEKYQKSVASKSDIERTSMEKEKTGVFTGAYAINPATKKKIPVWIADYVLKSYGTGAIMAVPAHDERDWEFAKKYELPVAQVITTPNPSSSEEGEPSVWTGEGTMMNSGKFDGTDSIRAQRAITSWLESQGSGRGAVKYKLRDWVFSRQRYWGEPIPLVHCVTDGVVPVPEKELPVLLPEVEKYEPTGTGESPLANVPKWVNTTCPKCGGPAKRETNTMPQWAGSCWYYLRFTDPKNTKAMASDKAMKSWLPVDMYIGGAEHAVLHLLYARFWHKALFDGGYIPKAAGDEPFIKLKNQGLILGEDGEKMSKSRGNVINPDDIVAKFGADTLRMFEMFMGPFEDAKPWDTNGLVGVRRFLDKVYELRHKVSNEGGANGLDALVSSITKGIEQFRFNTCVSDFMKQVNEWKGASEIPQADFETFLKLLSPFAPHLCEEVWHGLGHKTLLVTESWPSFNPDKVKSDTVTIVVQVNGKRRASLELPAGSNQATVEAAAMADGNVKKFVIGKSKKMVFVEDRLLNFVV